MTENKELQEFLKKDIGYAKESIQEIRNELIISLKGAIQDLERGSDVTLTLQFLVSSFSRLNENTKTQIETIRKYTFALERLQEVE